MEGFRSKLMIESLGKITGKLKVLSLILPYGYMSRPVRVRGDCEHAGVDIG